MEISIENVFTTDQIDKINAIIRNKDGSVKANVQKIIDTYNKANKDQIDLKDC